jgi:hypothetical protein
LANSNTNVIVPYQGTRAGLWPFAVNPDDVSRIYFRDPGGGRWHELAWEHTADLDMPFSAETLAYAKALAARKERFPDTRRALLDLLEAWNLGLASNRAERRMALRLAARPQRLRPGTADLARQHRPAEDSPDDRGPGGSPGDRRHQHARRRQGQGRRRDRCLPRPGQDDHGTDLRVPVPPARGRPARWPYPGRQRAPSPSAG